MTKSENTSAIVRVRPASRVDRGIALSARALEALRGTVERALEIARDFFYSDPHSEGFGLALIQIGKIWESRLFKTGRAWPLELDPDLRYTLKCVFAWAAREADTPVRLELRRFARLIGVTQ